MQAQVTHVVLDPRSEVSVGPCHRDLGVVGSRLGLGHKHAQHLGVSHGVAARADV